MVDCVRNDNRIIAFDKEKLLAAVKEEYVYKTSSGEPLKAAVYYPQTCAKGENGEKNGERGVNSCVICIHGGGWRSDDLNRLLPHAAYFSACGAVGVSIDYRLLSDKTDVRDGLKDVVDAVKFIRKTVQKRYGKRLNTVVLGDSAGGYYATCLGCANVLHLVDENVDPVDFVVDCNGIVDLTGKWSYGIADEKLARAYSPLFNVSVNDAPTLILHGTVDQTVLLEDAVAYEKALREKGVPCELRVLQGAAHAFILFDYRHDNAYVASVLSDVVKTLVQKEVI